MNDRPTTQSPDDEIDSAAETQGSSSNYLQSFARGLSVLRCFDEQAAAQTVSEVAQRTNMTRAGARRILLTLLQLGYVAQDGRLFRLTPKVLDLGFAYLASQPVWRLAQPVLEKFSAATHQPSSMAVLDDDEIVCVLRIAAPNRLMTVDLSVGRRFPAYCTALGRVLLAGLPPEQAAEVLSAAAVEPRTSNTVTDHDKLLEIVDHARQHGWSMIRNELEPGLIAIAAPVRDRSGKVVAAISVHCHGADPMANSPAENLLPPLQAAAASISLILQNQG
ncbi:IclR family transcriptional regulator domain-containing protein [Paraburkholderia sp. ZP32-5]|uniref:IclR family transcriptional regulator domain-containing protein n=1 Tax=Paraburkholderia sp. ZP32-5 TaxID=2883245 RepID=UPI001F1D887A|nr:IclR family transcriptional regulator C-terminal domain-containing protein [Paraburkholderia sp. ZP32-5]